MSLFNNLPYVVVIKAIPKKRKDLVGSFPFYGVLQLAFAVIILPDHKGLHHFHVTGTDHQVIDTCFYRCRQLNRFSNRTTGM